MTEMGSSSLTNAAAWLQATLLGAIATTIAVMAIATVGFLMLSGRVDWRRGVGTVVGCFILFGAPTIATGIVGAARSGQGGYAQTEAFASVAFPAASGLPLTEKPQSVCWTCGTTPPNSASAGDPYAGASVAR